MERNLAGIIRELREAKGWTQDDLAVAAGMNRVTIAKYEAGKIEPKSKSLQKLAAALDISSDVLLGYGAEPTDEDRDLWDLRESVRRDPERRELFRLARYADIGQVRQAVAVLDAIKRTSGGDNNENP